MDYIIFNAASLHLIKRHGELQDIPQESTGTGGQITVPLEHFHTMVPLDPASPQPKPICGGSRHVAEDYNLKLHIAALVVMLVTSSIAAYAPIYIRHLIKKQRLATEQVQARANDSSVSNDVKPKLAGIASTFFNWTLWAAKHFGTGIIIGTAFIHILPGAHAYLTAPCLPDFFTDEYSSLPDAIAMAAMFSIFLIDFTSKSWIESTQQQALMIDPEKGPVDDAGDAGTDNALTLSREESRSNSLDQPALASSYAHEDSTTDLTAEMQHQNEILATGTNQPLSTKEIAMITTAYEINQRYQRQQELLSILIVEAGTCFHSIFLGLSLALATGDGFTALFIAIVFHQVFEGFAIGSRLASIDLEDPNSKDWKLWMCSTIYGITTPVGVAIGIAVHQDYDLASARSLILTGVFDSMSAGFLLYGGLVGLLSGDFLHGELSKSPAKIRFSAVGLVTAGMLMMGVLGRFA